MRRSACLSLLAFVLVMLIPGCGITGGEPMPTEAIDTNGPIFTDSHDPYAEDLIRDPYVNYR